METTLDRIQPGMRALVTELHVEQPLRCRLRDFGLIPGTEVCCRCRSPWRDVIALELRGSVLAIRSRDARYIRVRTEV